MVKLKLKIFRSCRSKHPSTLPDHPVPIFHHNNNNNNNNDNISVPPHQQQPHRSSFKSHVSSAFGCGSKSGDCSDSDYFQWQEDDQWHVFAKIYDVESPRRKIYNSSVSDDDSFPFPLPRVDKKKRRRGRRRLNSLRHASTDSGEGGLFSSESGIEAYCDADVLEDESKTLISCSRSFSTDYSTDFNPQLETIREFAVSKRNKLRKKRNLKPNGRVNGKMTSPEYGSPARLSVFKKVLPCEVAGKMKESFALVKRSEEPYEDFKRSMVEMIMEKEMYEEDELEQMLQCYLSLNSRFHHGVIVEAFSEIWDTMFAAAAADDST